MEVKSEGNFYLFIVSKGGEGGKGYETDSSSSLCNSQYEEEIKEQGAIVYKWKFKIINSFLFSFVLKLCLH